MAGGAKAAELTIDGQVIGVITGMEISIEGAPAREPAPLSFSGPVTVEGTCRVVYENPAALRALAEAPNRHILRQALRQARRYPR